MTRCLCSRNPCDCLGTKPDPPDRPPPDPADPWNYWPTWTPYNYEDVTEYLAQIIRYQEWQNDNLGKQYAITVDQRDMLHEQLEMMDEQKIREETIILQNNVMIVATGVIIGALMAVGFLTLWKPGV